MIVGVDIVNEGRTSIMGLTASYSKYNTQFYSTAVKTDLHKDMQHLRPYPSVRPSDVHVCPQIIDA